MIDYPDNTIWYIEARSGIGPNGEGVSQGSAVAVWLKKKQAESAGRRYLLTCAHVVRGISEDGKKGFGPPVADILAWKPGTGFINHADRRSRSCGERLPGAHIVKPVANLAPGDVPLDQRHGASDWVLLQVEDAAFSSAGAAVHAWSKPAERGLKTVGYPGGSAAWNTGDIVTPTGSEELRVAEMREGVIVLHGPEKPRPGMSGGALFNTDGSFAGLHRSSFDAVLQNRAIAASHIRDELSALGYDVLGLDKLPVPKPPAPKPIARQTTSRPQPGPIENPDDLQKGRWGGKPTRSGRRLRAIIDLDATTRDVFWFDLVVESVDKSPLASPVVFHLHDTYDPCVRTKKIIVDGRFTQLEDLDAYETFTVGAQVLDRQGEWIYLELDLNTHPDIPKRFKTT